jgi:hypothetical protein
LATTNAAAKNNGSLTAEVIDRLEKSLAIGEEDMETYPVARRFAQMYLKTMSPCLIGSGGSRTGLRSCNKRSKANKQFPARIGPAIMAKI